MVTCMNKYIIKIFPLCMVSSEKWFSGLVSRPMMNTVNPAKPLKPLDSVCQWFSSLDSIGGCRLCH